MRIWLNLHTPDPFCFHQKSGVLLEKKEPSGFENSDGEREVVRVARLKLAASRSQTARSIS